jgi:hypothetical protein
VKQAYVLKIEIIAMKNKIKLFIIHPANKPIADYAQNGGGGGIKETRLRNP